MSLFSVHTTQIITKIQRNINMLKSLAGMTWIITKYKSQQKVIDRLPVSVAKPLHNETRRWMLWIRRRLICPNSPINDEGVNEMIMMVKSSRYNNIHKKNHSYPLIRFWWNISWYIDCRCFINQILLCKSGYVGYWRSCDRQDRFVIRLSLYSIS